MRRSTGRTEPILRRYWNQLERLAQQGAIDELPSALLRLPDKLSGHKDAPEVDYRLVAGYVRGLELSDSLQATVAGLLEAHCLYRAGDTVPARERFAQARADAAALGAASAAEGGQIVVCLEAMACCGEALARMRAGELREAARLAREAVRVARGADSAWLKAYARHTLGRVLGARPEERKRARALLEQAANAYRSQGAKDLRGEAYVLHILGRLEADAGESDRALQTLHRGLSLMRRSRADRGAATLLIDLGWLRSYQQSYALARTCGREALEILNKCQDHRGLAKACHLIGWTSLCEGAYQEARAQFSSALEQAEHTACPGIRSASAYYLARCAYEMNADAECRKWLGKADELCECDPLVNATVRSLVAAQAIRSHQWERAERLLSNLAGDLKAIGVARLEADGLFLCGFELCRQGRQKQAAPLLRRALQVAETAQAANAMQSFLSGGDGAGLDHWLAAVVDASEQGKAFAQRLVDQTQGLVFMLHSLKNLAGRITDHLQLNEGFPDQEPLDPVSIRKTAEEITGLARRLYEATKLGTPILSPRLVPVDLGAFVHDQVALSNKYLSRGIEYVAEVEPDVPEAMADETLLAEIMRNFRDNAVQYVAGHVKHPRVVISARARRDERGKPLAGVLGFSDNGPGIHPDNLEVIFAIGKDPDDYVGEQQAHGWGVGLGFCRVVAEGMGGDIWAESEPGQGAQFFLELSLA